MESKVFAVYDCKAEAYLNPITFTSRGLAVRVFAECVNNPEHSFSKHPEDYTLFEIGTFDMHSAVLGNSEHGKVCLGTGIEFKEVGDELVGKRSVEGVVASNGGSRPSVVASGDSVGNSARG